jgi:hypothetical protein
VDASSAPDPFCASLTQVIIVGMPGGELLQTGTMRNKQWRKVFLEDLAHDVLTLIRFVLLSRRRRQSTDLTLLCSNQA